MTDAEVIKALECCGTYKGKCTDCPAFVSIDRSNCKKVLLGAAEIITRQKAEIERLNRVVETIAECSYQAKQIAMKWARAEAIKEFEKDFVQKAEKTRIIYVADTTIQEQETGWYQISIADFDNLVK